MGVIDLKIDSIRNSNQWKGRHERIRRMHTNSSTPDQLNPQPTEVPNTPHSQEVISTANQKQYTMDPELYKLAAAEANVDDFINALERISAEKNLPLPTIFDQLSPLQNTFLHVAASSGHDDVSGLIAHHFPTLLKRTNHKGDTALHLAARAGHLGVVQVLLEFSRYHQSSPADDIESNNGSTSSAPAKKLRVTGWDANEEGNLAFHDAMINNRDSVVDYFVSTYPDTAYHVNKEGKSAIYLGVEAGKVDHVKTALEYRDSIQETYHDLDELLLKGRSLIHAAILGKNTVMLREITKHKPMLINLKDENGQNPLHCAASMGFLEGVHLLLNKFNIDAFEWDYDGSCPVHIASKNGHVYVIQELLQHCPISKEFLNRKGHNILHVAAMYGKDNVVKYILKTPGLELLINEKDKDGNTALHLATINWHPKVVSSLTWDKRVNLKLVNNEGLTALEVAEEYMESLASFRQRLTWVTLKSAGVPRAKLKNKEKLNRLKSAKYEPDNMNYCKDRVNTLLLVSTLVATVTFAAGFTMPGGYNNSEPDQGMATLTSRHKFQIFVVCDTIAMYSSIIVAVTLIWAQLGDLNLVLNALRLALPLLGISLTVMSLAFMVSVYLVVGKIVWLANFVLIMGIVFLTSLLALFLPLYPPYSTSSSHPISRYIGYYPSILLMRASGSYDDDDLEE